MSHFTIPAACHPASTSAPIPTASAPSSENIATESLSSEFNQILDSLKPKLKEIVQEIIAEETKLREQLKTCDPLTKFKKLPVLPTLASNLPEGIKSKLKACIEAAEKPKTA